MTGFGLRAELLAVANEVSGSVTLFQINVRGPGQEKKISAAGLE